MPGYFDAAADAALAQYTGEAPESAPRAAPQNDVQPEPQGGYEAQPDVQPEPQQQDAPEPNYRAYSLEGVGELSDAETQQLLEYGYARYMADLHAQQEQRAPQRQQADQSRMQPQQTPQPGQAQQNESELAREYREFRERYDRDREEQRASAERQVLERRANEIQDNVKRTVSQDPWVQKHEKLASRIGDYALYEMFQANRAGKRLSPEQAVKLVVGEFQSIEAGGGQQALTSAVSQSVNPQPGRGGAAPGPKPEKKSSRGIFDGGFNEELEAIARSFEGRA